MSAVLLLLASATGAAAPLGEAWIRHDRVEALVPGVGRAEGRREEPDGTWVRVVVEPWAIDPLRARTEVRDYDPDPSARRSPLPPGYHDPDEVLAALEALEPAIARGGRLTAGWSTQGRPIEALWLGQPPDTGAPAVRVLGAHHGDELVSVEVALALAERLVTGDGVDPEVSALLDRATVWLVPVVNPDGVAARTRESGAGVDLNRNYDFAWSAGSVRPGAAPFSEPETRAIRALALTDRPMLSVSLHAGEANFGWPWNFTVEDPPDAVTFATLAEGYAAGCGAPGFWVTQGADWYVTFGDTNDWAYGRHGTLDFTLELADERAPADLDEALGWHGDALLQLLATPPTVSGIVSDLETGAPVEAAVSAGTSDRPVYASPVTGAFHLITPPGAETLTVRAPGYAAVEVPIGAGPVDVALAPASLGLGRLVPSVVTRPTGVLASDRPLEGLVTLVQPGADPVQLAPELGVLHLDPAELGPGFWTVVTEDRVLPRAVLVEAAEDVVVEGHTVDERAGTVTVEAGPLSRGVRAWAVGGDRRSVLPVPVVSASASEVVLDVSGLPADRGPVDLMLQSGGATLAIHDVSRPGRRSGPEAPDEVRATSCGCAGTGGGQWGPTGVAGLLLWVVSRRRRSVSSSGGCPPVRRSR